MSADSLHYCSRVTHWVERVEACSPGGRLQTAGSLLVFWFSGVPFLHLWRYLEVNSTWGKMKRDTFKVQLYSQNGRHTGIRLAKPNKNQNHCPLSPDLNRDLSPPRHRRVELLHSAGAPCSNAKLMDSVSKMPNFKYEHLVYTHPNANLKNARQKYFPGVCV